MTVAVVVKILRTSPALTLLLLVVMVMLPLGMMVRTSNEGISRRQQQIVLVVVDGAR